jgi:hypothetical protein
VDEHGEIAANYMGIERCEAIVLASQLHAIFPMTHPQTRMDTRLHTWIVIPVVEGSSPFSHPI